MTMKTKKNNLEKVFGEIKQSSWNKAAMEWKTNLHWIKRSQKIALEILEILDQKGRTQKSLAPELGVSAQQVSKWLSGKENLTLETISNFERVLQVHLIEVLDCSVTTPSQSTSIATILEPYDPFVLIGNNTKVAAKETKVIPIANTKYDTYNVAEGQ
jgi:antitoxin component HigA of HigAB toxin-antitoxin module